MIRLESVTFMKICDPTTRTKNIQASNTSSVTCDAALKLLTASTAIAVMPLKMSLSPRQQLALPSCPFSARTTQIPVQKGGNKIIKIAARGHGSAHERCLRCMHSIV